MKKFIIITLIILGFLAIMCVILTINNNKRNVKDILECAESDKGEITEYIVYGTHLNIRGVINTEIQKLKKAYLVFAGINGKEKKIELSYEVRDNKIMFSTSELINEGIDLEKLEIDKYIMLIELQGKYFDGTKHYLLENHTDYDNITYYTITKNKKNTKIDIKFDEGYMKIEATKSKLPKDVYDIVIDPGHGGSDTGAKGSGYDEADLNLQYGEKLKNELEKLGLKVKMTRDGTEKEENFGTQTVYTEKGRVNIVRRFKSKICTFYSFE